MIKKILIGLPLMLGVVLIVVPEDVWFFGPNYAFVA